MGRLASTRSTQGICIIYYILYVFVSFNPWTKYEHMHNKMVTVSSQKKKEYLNIQLHKKVVSVIEDDTYWRYKKYTFVCSYYE